MIFLMLGLACIKDPGNQLSQHYEAIEQRYYRKETKFSDRVFMQATYRAGIVGGYFVVPYASRILRHCIAGKSSTLQLRSRYISQKSPIVTEYLSSLKGKPDGTYHFSGYKQAKDWRLSMAFNPLNITMNTENDQRYATVWYDFAWPKPEVAYNTTIPLGKWTFSINDGLVHVVSDCPTYRVEQKLKLSKEW